MDMSLREGLPSMLREWSFVARVPRLLDCGHGYFLCEQCTVPVGPGRTHGNDPSFAGRRRKKKQERLRLLEEDEF